MLVIVTVFMTQFVYDLLNCVIKIVHRSLMCIFEKELTEEVDSVRIILTKQTQILELLLIVRMTMFDNTNTKNFKGV